MAGRRIEWTEKSINDLRSVLEYFNERNRSSNYSKKLYKSFIKELKLIAKSPDIGKRTKYHNIRGLIIKNYIIFYRIETAKIVVLKLWDCRRNPDILKF